MCKSTCWNQFGAHYVLENHEYQYMIDQVVVSVRTTAVSVVELFPKEIATTRLKCGLAKAAPQDVIGECGMWMSPVIP